VSFEFFCFFVFLLIWLLLFVVHLRKRKTPWQKFADDVFDLLHSIFPCICKPEKRSNPRALYGATKSQSTVSAVVSGSEEDGVIRNIPGSSPAGDDNQSDLKAPNNNQNNDINHNGSKKIMTTSVSMKSTTVPTRHFNDFNTLPSSSLLEQPEKQKPHNSYSEKFHSHRTIVPTTESFLE
jgi:hypothetical protein